MKHNKTLLGIAVAGLMGLSPHALGGGWGDEAKQKMEAGKEKVKQTTDATKEKLGFGDKQEQASVVIEPSSLERDQIVEIQKALNSKGFHAAQADGEMGPATTDALKNFQEDQGLTASGELNQETIDALGVDIDVKQAQEESSDVEAQEQEDTSSDMEAQEQEETSSDFEAEQQDDISSDVEAQEQQETNIEESASPETQQQEESFDSEAQQQEESFDSEAQQQEESSSSMEPQQQEEDTSSSLEAQQQQESMDAPHQSASVEAHSSPLNSDQVSELQQTLNEKGFDAGNVDGIIGPETKNALESFQRDQGISASGELNQETIDALGLDVDLKQAQEESSSQKFSE